MNNEPEQKDERKRKREMGQRALFAWYSALKNAHLYPPQHPSFQEGANRVIAALGEIFQSTIEFSVQQAEGLFRIEDEIFIEESLTMYALLKTLEEARIGHVLFLSGIRTDEVAEFLSYLVRLKGPATGDSLFANEHIRAFLEAPAAPALSKKERTHQRIKETFDLMGHWTTQAEILTNHLLEEQHVSMSELSNPLDELADAIQRNPSLFSIFFATESKGPVLPRHAARTIVFSLYVGQQLGLDPSTLKLLAIASLFHDVGRALLPSDLGTGTRLRESDRDFISLHSRDGASFLAGVQGLPVAVVRVALEHHVGYDGIGYPLLPPGFHPHTLSQIVGLADFVSWQTLSEIHYHKPEPLYKIVRAMIRRSGTQFHPVLVKLAAPFLGLFPSGTRLLLDGGATAISLEPNMRNLHRPAVAVEQNSQYTYQWLSQVSSTGFEASVDKAFGAVPSVEPLLPLIPTLFQTNT